MLKQILSVTAVSFAVAISVLAAPVENAATNMPQYGTQSVLQLALVNTADTTSSSGSASKQFFDGSVYVTLQKADAVEVLPQKTIIRGLTSAHYDAVSPNGKLLVVGSFTTGNVFIVNTQNNEKMAAINIGGKSVQGVAVTPDNRMALAVDPNAGLVAVIDLKNMKLIQKIKVGRIPHNIAFSADGNRAYVTLQGGTGVAVINMKRLSKTGEIPVPGIFGPHNLDFSGNGKLMWVRDIVGNVAVVDVASRKELAVIPVGHGHAGIDVLPGGKYVVTGAIADDVVDVIDANTFKVVKRIVVGKGPHGVRASRDGRWIYVDDTVANDIEVIDAQTLQVVAKISTTGDVPFWVAVPWHV